MHTSSILFGQMCKLYAFPEFILIKIYYYYGYLIKDIIMRYKQKFGCHSIVNALNRGKNTRRKYDDLSNTLSSLLEVWWSYFQEIHFFSHILLVLICWKWSLVKIYNPYIFSDYHMLVISCRSQLPSWLPTHG